MFPSAVRPKKNRGAGARLGSLTAETTGGVEGEQGLHMETHQVLSINHSESLAFGEV
jgi:hypothetical protein